MVKRIAHSSSDPANKAEMIMGGLAELLMAQPEAYNGRRVPPSAAADLLRDVSLLATTFLAELR
jgi:hypothetical protein